MNKKFLVVGFGSIGKRHHENLKKILMDDSLIFVFDPQCDQKNSENLNLLKSLDDFSNNTIDSALICTPNHVRKSVIEPLIKKGVRNFFIEKPIATSSEHAQELVKLLEENNCMSFVGCNLRFHKALQELKQALNQDKIGLPLYARATFSHFLPNWRPNENYKNTYSAKSEEGGGIALDCIHEVDYLLWLFGSAKLKTAVVQNTGLLQIEAEEIATYVLEHENIISEIFVDYLRQDKIRKCDVIGEKGTLEWCSRGKNPEHSELIFYNKDTKEIIWQDEQYDTNEQYILEMKSFIECSNVNSREINSASDAMNSLKIIEDVKNG